VLLMATAGALVWAARRMRVPPATAATIDRRPASVAILPLENLGAPASQYFADGMTEALTTQLAKIEALKVMARGAVLRYAADRSAPSAIAEALSVAHILEGSVLLVDDRVWVTARLVDGATDRTIWAESYDGELRDILALQGRVAGLSNTSGAPSRSNRPGAKGTAGSRSRISVWPGGRMIPSGPPTSTASARARSLRRCPISATPRITARTAATTPS